MINYLFLNGTSWVLCITRGNFSFSSKDTKSIFEILIFFSFFLNITNKRWSKILNHSMFIIARKLPNQINFRDCFDHPSTNFPKKKKNFLSILYYTCTQIFLQISEFSKLNKFPWRHCSNILASHRVRM